MPWVSTDRLPNEARPSVPVLTIFVPDRVAPAGVGGTGARAIVIGTFGRATTLSLASTTDTCTGCPAGVLIGVVVITAFVSAAAG